MSTTTLTQVAAAPRVNLLPPEIAQAERFKRVQFGLGGAALAALLVVGLLYSAAMAQSGEAQRELDEESAKRAALTSTEARYRDVPKAYEQLNAANVRLGTAMGQDVRWSQVMNDLGLTLPARVWLTKLTVTLTPGAGVAPPVVAPVAGTPAAAGTPAPTPAPVPVPVPVDPSGAVLPSGLGQVQFEGVAYSHKDVAALLNALATQKGFGSAFFTESKAKDQDADTAGRPLVTFKAQVALTETILSRRFAKGAR